MVLPAVFSLPTRLLAHAQFTGYLSLPGPGTWMFDLTSAGGSRLLLDGALVVNLSGYHSGREVTGTVPNLAAGLHSIQ